LALASGYFFDFPVFSQNYRACRGKSGSLLFVLKLHARLDGAQVQSSPISATLFQQKFMWKWFEMIALK
jgi:hypothetical protein